MAPLPRIILAKVDRRVVDKETFPLEGSSIAYLHKWFRLYSWEGDNSTHRERSITYKVPMLLCFNHIFDESAQYQTFFLHSKTRAKFWLLALRKPVSPVISFHFCLLQSPRYDTSLHEGRSNTVFDIYFSVRCDQRVGRALEKDVLAWLAWLFRSALRRKGPCQVGVELSWSDWLHAART